jgi:hypothetical protein
VRYGAVGLVVSLTLCAEHDALAGIEANYADKSKCAPQFNAYKACKKSEYEAARAARIKASRGCVLQQHRGLPFVADAGAGSD